MTRFSVASFALSILLGCDAMAPTAGISFDVTKNAYMPGEFVEYRLSNRSDHEFVFNLCGAVLMRAEGDQWTVAGSNGVCIATGPKLAVGATVTGGELLPSDLSEGSYRFSMHVDNDELHTRIFRVE